jgi:hypothetical protein
MDCHALPIINFLKQNTHFTKEYNIKHILLNRYVVHGESFFNNKEIDQSDIEMLNSADLLILQVIEKDRGFLNNHEVIRFCKEECIIIKIPHYRNSIYEYKILENYDNKFTLIDNWKLPNKINNIDNVDETIKVIETQIEVMNSFSYDRDEMLRSMNFKINEFNEIDNLSDIKMSNYYIDNYKKYRLFLGRGYPSSRFFFELTNKLLLKLELKCNDKFIDGFFAQNTSQPIPTYWHSFCNFQFDNIYYTFGNIEITECEWYYILLLSKNANIVSKEENIKYINKIRKISDLQ